MKEKQSTLGKLVAIGALVTTLIAVLAYLGLNPPDLLKKEPIPLTLVGVHSETTQTITQDFSLSETNEDHKTIGTNTKSYSKRFNATDGYSITNYEWIETSRTRASNLTFNIDQGGKSILVSFSLKAGPITDQYRGWLKGALRTTQTRKVPESEVVLATNIDVAAKKTNLPPLEYETFDILKVLDKDLNFLGNLELEQPLNAELIGRRLTLSKAENGYVLRSVNL